jgi:hypothetical protein
MIFGKFIAKLFGTGSRSAKRAHSVIVQATRPVIEALECLRYLSTETYTLTSPSTAIFLEATFTPGEVDVRTGSAFGPIVHQFTVTTDQDEIISPTPA